ncbi:hypothetical protein Tco_0508322 [Tanacetum coccineum]
MKDSLKHSFIEQPKMYSRQRHHQGSQRLLQDILISWDGYQLFENDHVYESDFSWNKASPSPSLYVLDLPCFPVASLPERIKADNTWPIHILLVIDPSFGFANICRACDLAEGITLGS